MATLLLPAALLLLALALALALLRWRLPELPVHSQLLQSLFVQRLHHSSRARKQMRAHVHHHAGLAHQVRRRVSEGSLGDGRIFGSSACRSAATRHLSDQRMLAQLDGLRVVRFELRAAAARCIACMRRRFALNTSASWWDEQRFVRWPAFSTRQSSVCRRSAQRAYSIQKDSTDTHGAARRTRPRTAPRAACRHAQATRTNANTLTPMHNCTHHARTHAQTHTHDLTHNHT